MKPLNTFTLRLIYPHLSSEQPKFSDKDIVLPQQTFMSADSFTQTTLGILAMSSKTGSPYQTLAISNDVSTVFLNEPSLQKIQHALSVLLNGAVLPHDGAVSALQELVAGINNCGGVFCLEDGTHTPKGDPTWSDLGAVAISAEAALQCCGVPAALIKEDFEGDLDDLLAEIE